MFFINIPHGECMEFYQGFLYQAKSSLWSLRKSTKANRSFSLRLSRLHFLLYFHYIQTEKSITIHYKHLLHIETNTNDMYCIIYTYFYTESIARCRRRDTTSRTIILFIYRSPVTAIVVVHLTRSHVDAHLYLCYQPSRPFPQLLLSLVVILRLQKNTLYAYKKLW